MFDNPKKELQRLQERLLEAEEEELWESRENDAEYTFREMKQMLDQENWEEEDRQPLYRSYAPQTQDEVFYPEDLEPEPIKTPVKVKKKKKDRSFGGLLAALLLETAALIAVLVWWLLWR